LSSTRADRPTAEQERELVAALRAGDELAFDRLARDYLPGLYRFALRRVDDDRELARDLVQTTMCKVIERLDSYRGEAALFTWLCACCRNEIAAHFRRLGRRPREVAIDAENGELAAVPAAGQPAEGGDQEARLLRRERAERVHLTLDRLPPAYAQAVEWRYLEGLGVPEIARRLATTYKAAESLLSRARQAFRAGYDEIPTALGAAAPGEALAQERVSR
jgi:RNA polymerase sigma-70 factor (ECF subfamily)